MLTAISGFFVAKTYARYASKITGTTTAEAAAWQIDINDGGSPASTYTNAFTLAATKTASAYSVADVIAPGDKGSFPIVIDPTGTEVAFNYSVKVSNNATPITVPAGLKFYWGDPDAGGTELVLGTAMTPVEVTLPGNVAFTDASKITNAIYWKWTDLNTDTANEADTNFQNTSISFPVEIKIEQAFN